MEELVLYIDEYIDDKKVKKQMKSVISKHEYTIYQNYCLYGLLVYILEILKSYLNKQIKEDYIYYYMIIFELHTFLSYNNIDNNTKLRNIIRDNQNKINFILDMEFDKENFVNNYLSNFHLYFTKEDFNQIGKILKNVDNEENCFYLGASLEQIFYVDNLINNRKIRSIPFSGNMFICDKNTEECIINKEVKSFIDQHYLDILNNSFNYLIENKEKKQIWDYFHKGRSLITLLYLFSKTDLIDIIEFHLIVTDMVFVDEFQNYIEQHKTQLKQLNIDIENIELIFHYIEFEDVKTSSYMINSDDFPKDFKKYMKNMNKTDSVIYPKACSRCTPQKGFSLWIDKNIKNIYKFEGKYDKDYIEIENYLGCNYGRLFIMIYLREYEYL